MRKTFLLVVLIITTIWNGFTIAYGTIQILGDGLLQIAVSIVLTTLILGIILNTRRIIEWHSGFIGVITKFFWLIALGYNFYASWTGNENIILGEGSGQVTSETVVIVVLTLLMVASPVLLSTRRQWGTPISTIETLPPNVEVIRHP